MKKLFVLFIALFSLNVLFAAIPPTINNGGVTFDNTIDGVYYIDYSQFVTPGSNCIHWGAGYIDLDTRTRVRDSFFQGSDFSVKVTTDCEYIKFVPTISGIPGSTSYHEFDYIVYDGAGIGSNVGTIMVRINWNQLPQAPIPDPCN